MVDISTVNGILIARGHHLVLPLVGKKQFLRSQPKTWICVVLNWGSLLTDS